MFACMHDDAAYDAAFALCRGSYQRDLLRGAEAISGSTLKGKAKRFGGKYQRSAINLMRRLDAAGIPHGERRGPHGRRIIVIGIGCQEAP